MSSETNTTQEPEQDHGTSGLILQLLGETRAMVASLQTQVTEMRQGFNNATLNLDRRIRDQEKLHGRLLYVIAGISVLAIACNGIGLFAEVVMLFRLLERLSS